MRRSERERVDIVIPVYNEEEVLEKSIVYLHYFLKHHLHISWKIVIADNASTDSTPEIGKSLAKTFSEVEYLRIPVKGRGIALRAAWLSSDADYVAYMDVDLATSLEAFPRVIKALQDGHNIVIGSRLLPGADIVRSLKRDILSRGYNLILKEAFKTKISDAQCGFKALRASAAKKLVPLVQNNNWFFDTELLIIAERLGWRVFETPVVWHEGFGTKVDVAKTVYEYLSEIYRLKKRLKNIKL